MIKAVRGTRDLLPPETALWNFVEAAVRDVFRAYNFQEIRTPIFEATELFARGVGEETDIVSKEMYTWEDGAKRFAETRSSKKWIRGASFRRAGPLPGSTAEAAQPLYSATSMIREIRRNKNNVSHDLQIPASLLAQSYVCFRSRLRRSSRTLLNARRTRIQ